MFINEGNSNSIGSIDIFNSQNSIATQPLLMNTEESILGLRNDNSLIIPSVREGAAKSLSQTIKIPRRKTSKPARYREKTIKYTDEFLHIAG